MLAQIQRAEVSFVVHTEQSFGKLANTFIIIDPTYFLNKLFKDLLRCTVSLKALLSNPVQFTAHACYLRFQAYSQELFIPLCYLGYDRVNHAILKFLT